MDTHPLIPRIVLIGPPGSGKGTQAERLSEFLNIPTFSIGALLRAQVAKDDARGQELGRIMAKGELVSNDLSNAIVQEIITSPQAERGYILDGYPRDGVQAQSLEGMAKMTHVLLLDASDEAVVNRLSRRRVCEKCGRTFHLDANPSPNGERCPCGGTLIARRDDSPQVIRHRLAIYHEDTEPILDHYELKGVLYHINGEQSITDVWNDIKRLFS